MKRWFWSEERVTYLASLVLVGTPAGSFFYILYAQPGPWARVALAASSVGVLLCGVGLVIAEHRARRASRRRRRQLLDYSIGRSGARRAKRRCDRRDQIKR